MRNYLLFDIFYISNSHNCLIKDDLYTGFYVYDNLGHINYDLLMALFVWVMACSDSFTHTGPSAHIVTALSIQSSSFSSPELMLAWSIPSSSYVKGFFFIFFFFFFFYIIFFFVIWYHVLCLQTLDLI